MSSPQDKKCPTSDFLDQKLRPTSWDDFVGQDKIKDNVRVILKAAKQRGETPDHFLFHGNAGLGKTTMAQIIAAEIGSEIKITSGPAIERPGDLVALLTALKPGAVLFIDEIHRLSKVIEETLYPAIEDFKISIMLGKGPMARIMEMELEKFTLIGATTKLSAISSPLRSRFGALFGLNFYEQADIEQILARSAKILNIAIDEESIPLIAQRSRFTPRVANHLLKRVRDFAQVKGRGSITPQITQSAFDNLEIDGIGLLKTDLRLLRALIEKFNGGPAGIQALGAAIAEEEETVLEINEPYLLRLGFIERTPKGRVATELAMKHIRYKQRGGLF